MPDQLPTAPRPATRPGGRSGDVDADNLRRTVHVEEMVARTHERAADLYESWSQRQNGEGALDFEQRVRRHRELAVTARSVDRLAERTVSGFEVRVQAGSGRTAKGRLLDVLAALGRLRALVDRRIAETVGAGRREGATWAEIAAALGVTRQTAHERYRRRSL